jgi:hypothetical protein
LFLQHPLILRGREAARLKLVSLLPHPSKQKLYEFEIPSYAPSFRDAHELLEERVVVEKIVEKIALAITRAFCMRGLRRFSRSPQNGNICFHKQS